MELPINSSMIADVSVGSIVGYMLRMLLGVVLAAVLTFHHANRSRFEVFSISTAQKTYVLYGLIGSLIGVMVEKNTYLIGFIIFGLGGLMRFRTELESPKHTSRLILITLIGLTAGLNLPILAIMVTGFAYALIAVLESSRRLKLSVQGLSCEALASAAEAYRNVLGGAGCKVLGERKNAQKQQIRFVLRAPRSADLAKLESAFELSIPQHLRGAIDWDLER